MGSCRLVVSMHMIAVALVTVAISASPAAQSRSTRDATANTEILFVGTSGGPPLHADRSEPSALLTVDGRRYLIDCGIGTVRRLVEAGIAPETIGTILLTHLHPDHTLGLADVMADDFESTRLRLVRGESKTFDLYGPRQTGALVQAAFRYISIPYTVFGAERLAPAHLTSPFHVHEIQREGLVFQDQNIRVTAAENSHYVLMPARLRQQMKSYAYRIETPHGIVVFTGDTGPSDAVARLAEGADVLVAESTIDDYATEVASLMRRAERNHWDSQHTENMRAHFVSSHLDLEQVAALASKAHAKSVLLYHYRPADPAAYVAEVKKSFAGPVFAPADLDRFCMGHDSGARAIEPCQAKR